MKRAKAGGKNGSDKKGNGVGGGGSGDNGGSSSSRTFAEASKHIHENLQRHLARLPTKNGKNPDSFSSSSSEDEGIEGGADDVTSDQVLLSVFSGYEAKNETRTAEAIRNSLSGRGSPCLICISGLKRNDAVWSCQSCFCTFHLNCVQKWANDCIFQQKNQQEAAAAGGDTAAPSSPTLKWACPKCRAEQAEVPVRYTCYCGKVQDPAFDPWILPHSCGETCKRPLKPECGHQCLILCHPGPCPPCPKTVKQDCYCKNSAPAYRRCHEKDWSCGKPCGRKLNCGQHRCPQPCHPGECQPCQRTSVQLCQCQRHQKESQCATPNWQCQDKCGRPLECGHHVCEVICHQGACPPCPLSQLRSCPCGKTQHKLPCYEATPTCGNTCGKTLACGDHVCMERCHRGKCGTCLQMAKKSCRCGAKTREIACAKKDFTCDSKCKRMKSCGKHPCNRKCCDPQSCPAPCDLPCNKTLPCGNHKCPSRCHTGRCYPCSQTKEVNCNCTKSRVLVPCGLEKTTKPPKCKSKCKAQPNCHHPSRLPHSCHFGDCPPCKQLCQQVLPACGHTCPAPCHDNVEVKVDVTGKKKAATPWEAANEGTLGGARKEVKALACPDCQVPVAVTCLGGHETSDWPCFMAKASSCQRECGRSLPCGNHTCQRSCHKVKNAASPLEAGSNCRKCEAACAKPRPEGCNHPCMKPCHSDECDKCLQIIRIRCNCGLSQLYVKCGEWTTASPAAKLELACCKDQCPKQLACGHRCYKICHQGECGDVKDCKKKVKVYCQCKRLKQDVQCKNKGSVKIDCNQECMDIKKAADEKEQQAKEAEAAAAAGSGVDLSKQRVGGGGKRHRNRRRFEEEEDLEQSPTFFSQHRTAILIVVVVLIPILTAYYLCT